MKKLILLLLLAPIVSFGQSYQELKNMTSAEFLEFGKRALKEKGILWEKYQYEYARRNNTGIIIGNLVYSKSNPKVNIPLKAKFVKQSRYTSGNNDWVTQDFQTPNKYYSITLNKKKWEVISRFETDRN